jgi:hypothetical protein
MQVDYIVELIVVVRLSTRGPHEYSADAHAGRGDAGLVRRVCGSCPARYTDII